MDINDFFKELESLLKKIGLETAMMQGQEPQAGDTLRAALPVTEAGDSILLEVMAMNFVNDTVVAEIYTTILTDIRSSFEALKDNLLEWNLFCPLGAYGIYREGMQFYHKYNYLIPSDGDAEDMALEIFYLVNTIQDVITDHYPKIIRLSGNK